jgi:hypothetical protein
MARLQAIGMASLPVAQWPQTTQLSSSTVADKNHIRRQRGPGLHGVVPILQEPDILQEPNQWAMRRFFSSGSRDGS